MLNIENRLAYDENGLKDFFWPIKADEIISLRDTLTRSLGKKIFLEKKFAELRPCFGYVIRHIIELWCARKLKEEGVLREDELSIKYPMYLSACRKDSSGVKPLVVKRLEDPGSGGEKAKRIHNMGFGWLYELRLNFLKHNKSFQSVISAYANGGDTVVYGDNDVTRGYVVDNGVVARYESPFKRFCKAGKRHRENTRAVDQKNWDDLILLVRHAFESNDTNFSDEEREFTLSLFMSVGNEVARYESRLDKRKLPARLLTGTGGNVFTAILSKAVIENSGEVIRFDHSMGQGFAVRPATPVIDYPGATKFVTTNKKKIASVERAYEKYGFDNFLDKPINEIFRPPTIGPALKTNERECANNIKRVMYVPTVYPGDQVWFEPHVPDIVMLDWQIRLLICLKKIGYEVIVKPHPGSKIEFPKWLALDLDLVVCNDNFENVVDQADLFLFDKIQTTTFLTALKTKKPIVYAQIDQWDWMPGARAKLKKRVGMLETCIDSDNRIYFDGDSLVNVISESKSLVGNDDFYCSYVA